MIDKLLLALLDILVLATGALAGFVWFAPYEVHIVFIMYSIFALLFVFALWLRLLVGRGA